MRWPFIKKGKEIHIWGVAIAQCMLHRKQKSLKEMSLFSTNSVDLFISNL